MNDYYLIDGAQADVVDPMFSSLGAVLGALAGILTVIAAISLILTILQIVTTALIFRKAGQPWWKCLIPIYGQYIFFKIAWDPLWFWVTTGLGIISVMVPAMVGDATVVTIVCAVVTAFAIVIAIMFNVKLAKSFGRSGAFAVGLIFLGIIFQCILAFGGSQYVGPGGIPADEDHD